METIKVCAGTEVKLNIYNLPIGDLTMDDYSFEIEAYTPRGRRSLVFTKDQAIRVDENNYLVVIDTAMIGPGELWCRQTAQIPDNDLPDGFRKEVDAQFTGVVIVSAR
jgi:hypothetical protein